MYAFVPAPGLPLTASRTFVSGSAPSVKPRSATPSAAPTMISAGAEKFNALRKMASDKLGGAKKIPAVRKKKTATTSKMTVRTLPKFYNPKTGSAEFVATAKGQNATPCDVRLNPSPVTTNVRHNANDTFRNMDEYTDDLVWARSGWSSDEARVGVNVCLRNVLGNANMFESELAELSASISCVYGTANIKEFVRAVGLSHAYRSRFFEPMSNMRFIECNFLHFLGRAPRTQAEISEHIRIINEEGYNAEINSYVDSDEYDALFGESRVPAPNFRGGHEYNIDMNKLAMLNGGFGRSHRLTTKAVMPSAGTSQFPPFSMLRGMPESWRGENSARNAAGPLRSFPNAFWKPQGEATRAAKIDYTRRFGTLRKFWYSSSSMATERMKPQLTHSEAEKAEAAAILKYGSNMYSLFMPRAMVSDFAPVIEVQPPTTPEAGDGVMSLKMEKLSFPIPLNLQQNA